MLSSRIKREKQLREKCFSDHMIFEYNIHSLEPRSKSRLSVTAADDVRRAIAAIRLFRLKLLEYKRPNKLTLSRRHFSGHCHHRRNKHEHKSLAHCENGNCGISHARGRSPRKVNSWMRISFSLSPTVPKSWLLKRHMGTRENDRVAKWPRAEWLARVAHNHGIPYPWRSVKYVRATIRCRWCR